MNNYIIAIVVGIIQTILSINLIIRQKNRAAILSEIFTSLMLLMVLNEFSVQLNDTFGMYIGITLIEYLCVKIFLIVFFLFGRYCSFYMIKAACRYRRKKKAKKLKFVRAFTNVKYWPRVKLGLPGMADKIHKKTKVRFDSKGFPKFKSFYSVKLRKKYLRETRERHFYMANKILYRDICFNARLRAKFSKNQIRELEDYETPTGYTWHHHQDKGVLQLVESEVHAKTSHIGGYSIWGGK